VLSAAQNEKMAPMLAEKKETICFLLWLSSGGRTFELGSLLRISTSSSGMLSISVRDNAWSVSPVQSSLVVFIFLGPVQRGCAAPSALPSVPKKNINQLTSTKKKARNISGRARTKCNEF
jgi:hypothetical protein